MAASAKALRDGTETAPPAPLANGAILEAQAAWQITDILSGVQAAATARRGAASPTRPAPPTATATPGRSATTAATCSASGSAGADSGSVPGLSGYDSAAPILFEGFANSGLAAVPLQASAGRRVPGPRASDLPVTLERFVSPDGAGQRDVAATEPAPQIIFPPDGARVELGASTADATPLVLKLQGGRAPFRWLANGKPLVEVARRRTATWQPDGTGYSTLTVIDAAGRAASVKVFVE